MLGRNRGGILAALIALTGMDLGNVPKQFQGLPMSSKEREQRNREYQEYGKIAIPRAQAKRERKAKRRLSEALVRERRRP